MADLNVSMAMGGAERIQPKVELSTSKAAETLKEQNKDDSSRKERIKEALKDVIATSKDGDTAQASKTSKDKLEETKELGDVKELKAPDTRKDEPSAAKKLLDEMQKKQENEASAAERTKESIEEAIDRAAEQKAKDKVPEEKENPYNEMMAQEAAKKAAEKANAPKQNEPQKKQANEKPANNSYDSYSDSQLRQMYLKGDISRYDYDHEISTREESKESRTQEADTEKVFREGIVRALDNESRAERSNANIDRAFSEEANDNLESEQRMEMIDAAEMIG